MTLLTRAAGRLWSPRQADPLTERLLASQRADLRESRAALRDFLASSRELPRTDPQADRCQLRDLQADARITSLNVRDLERSYARQTRPRLWQRGRSR